MRTRGVFWWLTAAVISVSAHGKESPKLETMDQLTRIQIPITGGSSFRMLTGKSGELTLVVDRVSISDLAGLQGLSDKRVEKVSVKQLGLDKAEIGLSFREQGTESFAYQQGNNLVVDLWRNGGPAAKAVPAKAKPAVLPASLPKEAKKAPASAHRAPATVKPAAARLEVQPLRIERDLFQRFLLPMPELAVTAKDKGFDIPLAFELEDRWTFQKGDKTEEDGRAFEFAKKLFAEKKYGLCLKTIEILLRDNPQTKHEPELLFLRALAYKKLGENTHTELLVTRAEKMFEELAARRNERGESFPFHRLIALYFARKEIGKQNWLAAIQQLEYVSSSTPPKDPEFPYVQMLLAEAYGKVDQPRRAERLYRYVFEKFPKHVLGKEAAFRIADLLALEKNYQRVTEEGRAALAAYPEYEKVRSEVLFQVGEAYFWLGDYARAEKFLRRYTQVSSAHTNASLAWVRLGEIEEVHRKDTKAARQDYLRAKNGYPFSRGDLVATVRLARIDLPDEKEPAFVVKTLRELLSDQKASDWDLKRMAELTLSDYMLLTGETDKAIAIASAGMAQTDGTVYELYKRAYQKGLFSKLSQLSRGKKFAEALALYEREKKWLEEHGPETLKVAAEVYTGLGLYATANKLMERYSAEIAEGRVPASFAGQAPLSRAKAANSFARGAYADALNQLGGSQDAHSSYIRAMSHFRLRQKTQAYAAADRALPLISGARAQFTDDMIENLAEVLIDRDDGERDFPRMERDVAACRVLLEKPSERLSFAAADALWYQKKHKEAAPLYREALEKFPSGNRAERAKYNLGMSLVALGHREEAVKLLTELRNSGQSVWAESAKQEIQLIEWEKKYSSVLRTLPPGGLGISN